MAKQARTTEDKIRSVFAANLKAALRDRGVSGAALAEHLGISQQSISLYTNGSSQPTFENVVKMAEYLNVSVDYLFGRVRAAAPDDFVQAVVGRYGLSEKALEKLMSVTSATKRTRGGLKVKFRDEAQEAYNFLWLVNRLLEDGGVIANIAELVFVCDLQVEGSMCGDGECEDEYIPVEDYEYHEALDLLCYRSNLQLVEFFKRVYGNRIDGREV